MPDRGYFTYGGIEVLNPGVRGVQGRTIPTRFISRYGGSNAPPATAKAQGGRTMATTGGMMAGEGDMTEHPAGGSPMLTWLLGVGLLVLLHFMLRGVHDGPSVMGINVVNMLLITITAILGIVLFKVVFTRVTVPGLTPLIQAV